MTKVPFINAGDGEGEHPTQALLDMYTVWKQFKKQNKLSIGIVGDMRYSRTIHSLLKLLSLYKDVTYHLVCPDGLYIDPREFLKRPDLHFRRHESVAEMAEAGPDVLYVVRRQEERAKSAAYEYNPKLHYVNLKHVDKLPESSIVLHPLPRGNELAQEVDNNPRAYYWKQVKNGLFVRMALLNTMLDMHSAH